MLSTATVKYWSAALLLGDPFGSSRVSLQEENIAVAAIHKNIDRRVLISCAWFRKTGYRPLWAIPCLSHLELIQLHVVDDLLVVVYDQVDFVLVVQRNRIVVLAGSRFWIGAVTRIIARARSQTVEVVTDDVVTVLVFGYGWFHVEL